MKPGLNQPFCCCDGTHSQQACKPLSYLWRWGIFWSLAVERPAGTDTALPLESVLCSGWLLMSLSVSEGHSNASLSTAPPSGHCGEWEQQWIRLKYRWRIFQVLWSAIHNLWGNNNVSSSTFLLRLKCHPTLVWKKFQVQVQPDWKLPPTRAFIFSHAHKKGVGNADFSSFHYLRYLQKIWAASWVPPRWEACGSYGSSASSTSGSTGLAWWGWPRPCSRHHRPRPPLYCHTSKTQKNDGLAIIYSSGDR